MASNNQTTAKRLRKASQEGDAQVVVSLLDNGADVNAKADYGYTPLHYAAWNGHVEIARLLLDNGADVNAETDRGWTPLHLAVVCDCTETVELLREYGGGLGQVAVAPLPGLL